MTNEVTARPSGAIELAQPDFTAEQVQLLKDTVCKGATNAELALFREVCKAKRLDPFAKQIHAVKRWDSSSSREVMSFQTGIDGYRLIAERSGQYAGQDQPMWCGSDGTWKEMWTEKTPPVAARAAVYRRGFTQPMVRIARWSAYVQTKKDGTPNQMWGKMGPEQLHKCAEALALRAAFPEELSGLYTREEMGQLENEEPTRAEKVQAAQDVATEKLKALNAPPVVHDAEFVDEPPPAPPTAEELKPEKGSPTFDSLLGAFKDIRAEFESLGAVSRYYAVLKDKADCKHANEIRPLAKGRTVYAHMAAALKALKLDIVDREETQKLYNSLVLEYGDSAVAAAIGNAGSASWEDVPAAERDSVLATIRTALRAA